MEVVGVVEELYAFGMVHHVEMKEPFIATDVKDTFLFFLVVIEQFREGDFRQLDGFETRREGLGIEFFGEILSHIVLGELKMFDLLRRYRCRVDDENGKMNSLQAITFIPHFLPSTLPKVLMEEHIDHGSSKERVTIDDPSDAI